MRVVTAKKEFIFEEERDFDSCHASTVLQLANGEVLAAWFGGSWEKSPDTSIWLSRRTVNSQWLKPERVAEHRESAMWNPVLFQNSSGHVVLFYKVGPNSDEWTTFKKTSVDNGYTFSREEMVVAQNDPDNKTAHGPVKNKLLVLKDGTLLTPSTMKGDYWDCFVDISHDEGDTWTMSKTVPVRRVGYGTEVLHRLQEPTFCYGKGISQPTLWEDNDGVIHMFTRSTTSKIMRSDSYDRGLSWSTAYDSGLPNNNSGIDLARTDDGVLFLAYNPTTNLPNYYKGPRTPLLVAYSLDNGKKWKKLIELERGCGAFAYPAIIATDNSTILVTYTWKRERIAFWKIEVEK